MHFFFVISKHALYAWRAAHVLNLRPISSVFLPTVDTGGSREAKVTLALLMEGYSNFSISLLTTWNMSPPTLLKDSVFPGPPRHHHTFKKIKKIEIELFATSSLPFFLMAKGFNSWALWRRKYLGLVVFWGTKMSNNILVHRYLGFFYGLLLYHIKNQNIFARLFSKNFVRNCIPPTYLKGQCIRWLL